MSTQPNVVDTIVRFHDSRRLLELQRCVLSLVAQIHQPVHVHVVTQRFCEDDTERVRHALDPLFYGFTGAQLSVHNWSELGPSDARSHLINHGLKSCTGRFLGFLDYDDVLYPEAYQLLTKQLLHANAAIAFASVRLMSLQVCERFCYVLGEEHPPWSGNSLVDLFRGNFAPIHSYLIDKSRIDDDLLQFDCSLAILEDYEFLLRICARHRADFTLLGIRVGDYYHKVDNSNTNWSAQETPRALYRRRAMIALSDQVRAELNLPLTGRYVTVQDVLDRRSKWLGRNPRHNRRTLRESRAMPKMAGPLDKGSH